MLSTSWVLIKKSCRKERLFLTWGVGGGFMEGMSSESGLGKRLEVDEKNSRTKGVRGGAAMHEDHLYN